MIVQIGEMTLDCNSNSLVNEVKKYNNSIVKAITDKHYWEFELRRNYDIFKEFVTDHLGAYDVYAINFLNCYCMANYNISWEDILIDQEEDDDFEDEVIDLLYSKINDIVSENIKF